MRTISIIGIALAALGQLYLIVFLSSVFFDPNSDAYLNPFILSLVVLFGAALAIFCFMLYAICAKKCPIRTRLSLEVSTVINVGLFVLSTLLALATAFLKLVPEFFTSIAGVLFFGYTLSKVILNELYTHRDGDKL